MDRVRMLQKQLRARTYLKSPDALGAFVIDGHHVGRLTPKVMTALSQDPILTQLIKATDQTSFTLISPSDTHEINQALESVTLRLEALGMTQRRRNEKLDIFTREGVAIAQAERSVFRTLGLATRVVRLMAVTPDGHLWLQRRSPNKPIGPGLWDNLAAGMIAASESPLTAMQRELYEEAGIDADLSKLSSIAHLDFDCQCLVPEGWMQERTASFLLTVPSEVVPNNLDGEADAFACFTPNQVVEMIEADRLMPEAARLQIEWILRR